MRFPLTAWSSRLIADLQGASPRPYQACITVMDASHFPHEASLFGHAGGRLTIWGVLRAEELALDHQCRGIHGTKEYPIKG